MFYPFQCLPYCLAHKQVVNTHLLNYNGSFPEALIWVLPLSFQAKKKKKKKDIKALINFWYELPTFEWKDKQGKVRREFEATWKRSIFTADQ